MMPRVQGWVFFPARGAEDAQFINGFWPRGYPQEELDRMLPLSYKPVVSGQQPFAYLVDAPSCPFFALRRNFSDKGGPYDVAYLGPPVYLDIPCSPFDDWGRYRPIGEDM